MAGLTHPKDQHRELISSTVLSVCDSGGLSHCMVSARNSGFPDIQNPKQSAPDSNQQHLQNHASTTWRDNPRLGRNYHRPPPPIRAVRASSQASRAARASAS